MNESIKKVAIYVRVSKEKQILENQLAKIREYIKIKGWEEVSVYEDKITGKATSRKALDKLMQDARKGKFNHVSIWAVDRLGRSPIHMFQVVEEWKKLGIQFNIVTLGIDTSTPVGEFVFGLLAQVAKLERDFNIQRTNAGLDKIRNAIERDGFYITKEGKRITSLGRPKGKKDNVRRKKSGYHRRWAEK